MPAKQLSRRLSSLPRVALALGLVFLAACDKENTTAPHSPGAPDSLSVTVTGPTVQLTWTLGHASTSVRVLRRLNATPSGPTDPAATLVYSGTASAVDDSLTRLLPATPDTARTYHYAVFGCDASAGCEATGRRDSITLTLDQCLDAGGYTIYWRHASASVCADRTDLGTAATTMTPNWWKSCETNCLIATARQLSQTGIDQATAIGQALTMLGTPMGRVISSEFCRCLQTASNMGFTTVEQDSSITYFVYDEANRCAGAFAHIVTVPAAGTNTAIIGHGGFSTSCPDLSSLGMGEAAIYKPDAQGGARFVLRMTPEAWTALATGAPLLRQSPATMDGTP
jgi:hypothetical protein